MVGLIEIIGFSMQVGGLHLFLLLKLVVQTFPGGQVTCYQLRAKLIL